MKEAKVGVVIISFNNELHIEDAINSILAQDYGNWVCVIVDNGSTDNTFEIQKKIAGKDERISVFQKENEGPGAGRNFGFSKLPEDIEYVHFLDGDDYLKPDYLKMKVEYLNRHKNVGLVGCHYEKIDNAGHHLSREKRSRYVPGFFGFPKDLPIEVLNTPFVSFFASTGIGPFGLYRKSVFVKTGGYELKSQEDTDMFCKMALLAEVHFIPYHLYYKRITGCNLAYQRDYLKTHYQFREKWDLYKGKDEAENKMIENAIFYYYVKHNAIRSFKVGGKAFMEFLDLFSIKKLRWACDCFKEGLKELIFKTSYKQVMAKRKAFSA